jgi:hypothetical protein
MGEMHRAIAREQEEERRKMDRFHIDYRYSRYDHRRRSVGPR